MSGSLERKRAQLLKEIGQIQRLRRGQLSEQYYEKENAQGQRSRQGPYFVWQAWIKGKKRSIRVKREDVAQVREDLEAYTQYRGLCEALATVTEQLTVQAQRPDSKKNSRRSAKRSVKNSPGS
jgi:hypothetical protein